MSQQLNDRQIQLVKELQGVRDTLDENQLGLLKQLEMMMPQEAPRIADMSVEDLREYSMEDLQTIRDQRERELEEEFKSGARDPQDIFSFA